MKEKVKQFLINQIHILSQKFPEITFKYGFDETGSQHIIDVEPDTSFKNEDYMNAEFDCMDAFINEFPEDDLLFVSNNKYIKITTPVYIKERSVIVSNSCISQEGKIIPTNANLIAAPFPSMNYDIVPNFNFIEIEKPLKKNENNNVKFETELASTSNEFMPLAA